MRFRISVVFLVFLFSFPAGVFGYRWPFNRGKGAGGPHRVTGTFGEYRPKDDRLHAGVDLLPSDVVNPQQAIGVTVYAIEGAPGSQVRREGIGDDDERIIVGRFVYMHVETSRDLTPAGRPVTAGQAIARIKSLQQLSPHLHLAEFESPTSNIQLNPLRSDGLDNFEDNTPPTVWTPTVHRAGRISRETVPWGISCLIPRNGEVFYE